MSFEQSIRTVLQQNAEAALPPPQTNKSQTRSTPAQPQQLARDAVFAYSGVSGYAAVSDGLAFLASSMRSDSSRPGLFGGTPGTQYQSMSKSDGIGFVKNAMGFNIVDQLNETGLATQATSLAGQMFASLQSQTFNASDFYDPSVAISDQIASIVTSRAYEMTGAPFDAAVASLNRSASRSRSEQLLSFFGLTGGVRQNRLRDLGRMPEVKTKFLFYCDIEMWNGWTFRAMTVKSVSGPRVKYEQDNVNFYGLRSTVNKSTSYEGAQIVLYEDVGNTALGAMMALVAASTGSFGEEVVRRQNELQDMAGNNPNSSFLDGSTSIPSTATLRNRNGIIRSIRITQVYVDNVQPRRDVYTYVNPKIVGISRTDFDMDDVSSAHQVTLDVSYDALNVDINQFEEYDWREQRDYNAATQPFDDGTPL